MSQGLTHLAEFSMNTGDHPPIFQKCLQYSNIPYRQCRLRALSKNYIRPSKNPWASPMVTVCKLDGSARLCKVINSITQPVPFYMPRVDEVLESLGKAGITSEIDLTKGYYHPHLISPRQPSLAIKVVLSFFGCRSG